MCNTIWDKYKIIFNYYVIDEYWNKTKRNNIEENK